MEPAEKFLTVNTGELEWEDGEKVIGLPPGVTVFTCGRAKKMNTIHRRVD